jgi:hypothetical protein
LNDLQKKDPRRIIGGLRVHKDAIWNYSFLYPTEWNRYDVQDHYGFIYSPGDDPRTGFYVSVSDLSDELEEPVTDADLPALYEGILSGLQDLPDCKIAHKKEIGKEWAIGFELALTFSFEGETAKRQMWLLYNDRQQFILYGQGVPAQEYDVFHHTFRVIYDSFTFGDAFQAVTGRPTNPEITVSWTGSGENVQTEPSHPRDDLAGIEAKIAELKKQDNR